MIHEDLLNIIEYAKTGKEAKLNGNDGGFITVKKTGVGRYTVRIFDRFGETVDVTHLKYKGLIEFFKNITLAREKMNQDLH